MASFIFAYHGGKKPETPEEGEAMMTKWKEWIGANSDKFENPGNPVGMSKTVSAEGVADNGGSNPLNGFSTVKAETIEEAVELAKTCPHMEMEGGTIEVAEIKSM